MNNKLRNLRLESGLTQKELAKKINSTDKNVWAYEKGIAMPPYEILAAYADNFGVTTDYLIGRTDDFGTPIANAMGEGSGYSSEERRLIEEYRELNQSGKRLINETIKTLRATSAQSEQNKF